MTCGNFAKAEFTSHNGKLCYKIKIVKGGRTQTYNYYNIGNDNITRLNRSNILWIESKDGETVDKLIIMK